MLTYTQIHRELRKLERALRKVSFLKGHPDVEKLVKKVTALTTEVTKLYAEVSAAGQILTPVGPANPSSESSVS